MVMGYYICFLHHMETVPGRPKAEENLPNQSTVNKVHLLYPRAEKLKKSKSRDHLPSPLHKNPPKTL